MKMPALVLSLVFSFFLPLFAQADSAAPELLVVKLHADWCGSCLVLGPRIDTAREEAGLDESSALFVTLDLTDEATKHQAALLAHSLGLEAFFTSNRGKTGFAILVDAASGEIKGRLTKDMSAEGIAAAIRAEL